MANMLVKVNICANFKYEIIICLSLSTFLLINLIDDNFTSSKITFLSIRKLQSLH